MTEGYIKSLDGVRAVAIILVMTFHAELNHFGWMGVQLFFVLSGFLITSILWKEKFKSETLSFRLKKFWVRRSLRIFPLYFGFLFFLGILYIAFQFPSYYGTYIPYLATYTFNYTRTFEGWEGNPLFTHLWSLSIEEQFYLFFPLFVFFLRPRALKMVMLVFIILAPLIRYLLGEYFYSGGNDEVVVADAVYWHTLSHVDAFFMGGIIPVLSLDRKLKRPGLLLTLFFILAIGLGIVNFVFSGQPYYPTDLGYGHGQSANYEYIWHYTALNLVFAALILSLVSVHRGNKAWWRYFLESTWVVRIGRVSYGMYVFHWAVLVYFYNRFFSSDHPLISILLFLPYLAIVYGLAELSYRFFEVWFIKLKDRWFPGKKPGTQTVPNKVSNVKDSE